MSASSSIHILIDRPIVEHSPETFPSITFRDLPATVLGSAQLVISVMGNAAERQAFATDLRAAADFVEAWKRPAVGERFGEDES